MAERNPLLTDFLVIGGGIVGLNVARALRKRFSNASVTVLEKEEECGRHASGRNSGVLHAGFYYPPDSLKAKFTRDGNQRWTEYCQEKRLPIRKCGKLVVAQNAAEVSTLRTLWERGKANGVPVELVSAADARKIEPRAITHEQALHSPSTSVVDPDALMRSVREDAAAEGVVIRTGVSYLGRKGGTILTSQGPVQAGYTVNAAGLYADKIARDFGFSQDYRILPFKGLYLYSEEPVGSFRTHVYPVPDARYPFLGVHVTVTVDGRAKIGPTAVPALWREQYEGWENFQWSELCEILWRQSGLLLFSGFDFKRLAWEELQKIRRPHLVAQAARLAEGVRPEQYRRWGKPGVRAQLVHLKKRKLEMDFILEYDRNSLHILNAVSPGLTCAIPFAEHVCGTIAGLSHF